VKYEPQIDTSAVVAIDMHVHVERDDHGHLSLDDELMDASAAYFRSSDNRTPSVADLAERYRSARMAAVVFTVDATTSTGHPALSSEDIASQAADHADVLIPFGSVDPHRPDAVERVHRLVEESGVRGFKFHPTVQSFDPSDERWYPLYRVISDAGIPALFHTGQTGIGAGLPGGRGLRLSLSNLILLDSVAADFPKMQIIMAHPSVPWQDEAISVATHKYNTWIDLSGWSAKYFPESLVRAANSDLKTRVLFGSDFPLLTPDRWVRDAEQTRVKTEAMPGIPSGQRRAAPRPHPSEGQYRHRNTELVASTVAT
jgi:uncharacterized protein